ncbi:pectate lyase E like protein [Verticillium longisporum]|nr:pectate lyase E like protein [Verticillium longisporum]
MKFSTAVAAAGMSSLVSAQTLNIPTRTGNIISLPRPSYISGAKDFNNQEFDRGRSCEFGLDLGVNEPVFILENGASISNVIIGARQVYGVSCKDAIAALGTGDVLVKGGGARNGAGDIIRHNGRGTVTVDSFTVVDSARLYRSCGDCSNNGGPRNVVVKNVKVSGLKSELVGINSNFNDVATVSGSCGTSSKVCQEYRGVAKGSSSYKVTTTANCQGAQGKLANLPAC